MTDYANNKFEITKLTKSIVKLNIFKDVKLQVKDVKEIGRIILEFSKGGTYGILRYGSDAFYSSHKISSMIASKQFTENRYAIAFVIKSKANRMSAQMFIENYKPSSLAKVFDDENKAFEWLKEQEKVQYPKD